MKAIKNIMVIVLACVAGITHAQIQRVASERDFDQLINNGNPAVIEYSAKWCGVCNGIKSSYEELSNEAEFQNINFVQIDIDEMPTLSEKHGIVGVPTFEYLEGGNQKNQEVGIKNMGSFKSHMRKKLRGSFALAQNDAAQSIDELMKESGKKVEKSAKEMADQIEYSAKNPDAHDAGALGAIGNFFVSLIQMIQNLIVGLFSALRSIFQ